MYFIGLSPSSSSLLLCFSGSIYFTSRIAAPPILYTPASSSFSFALRALVIISTFFSVTESSSFVNRL